MSRQMDSALLKITSHIPSHTLKVFFIFLFCINCWSFRLVSALKYQGLILLCELKMNEQRKLALENK